jgi:AraC-like DNA-binding protein
VTCARTFLLDHVQENTPTVRLAAECGVSPFHLVRTFHKDVGLPPHAYLNCVRVERAKPLLGGGLTIAEVARRTGFADQSHFTRVFSRIVGMSPGRYKDGNRVQDGGLPMCDA